MRRNQEVVFTLALSAVIILLTHYNMLKHEFNICAYETGAPPDRRVNSAGSCAHVLALPWYNHLDAGNESTSTSTSYFQL